MRKIPVRSIKSLYPLALVEGEGVGTAYVYFAKRLVLSPWLGGLPQPHSMLIAGLPEKYGSSLDFFLLAQELGVSRLVVVDERPEALQKCRKGVDAAAGNLSGIAPEYLPVRDISRMDELNEEFDLCVTSEVLQRLGAERKQQYLSRLAQSARALALFTPNSGNASHASLSGLETVGLTDLQALANATGGQVVSGYVDMPPFPPGITRSAQQRQQAGSSPVEGIAMWALGCYARFEPLFPLGWRERSSHIAYALVYQAAWRERLAA